MPAEIDSMAYQGETPWHKIGTAVNSMNVEDALNLTSLHMDVEKMPMFLQDGTAVPRRVAIRRTDGRILSVVSNDYHVIQYREAMEVLKPACEQFGVVIETAGTLGNGDRGWVLAKMPESIEPIAGDKIQGYCLISTGHNGWTPYSARLTPVRVVCQNTLNLALKDTAFTKLVHTPSSEDKLKQVEEMITNMVTALKTSGDTFASLAAKKMNKQAMSNYIARCLGSVRLEDMQPVQAARHSRILELATSTGKGIEFAPNTAWAAFNAITEYVDHVRPTEVKAAKTLLSANTSAVFGANAKVKAKALQLAVKLAA